MANTLKILIVEDDPLLRDGLKLIVAAEEDMSVVGTASNGLEALSQIGFSKPDLVLLDLQMPEMDGIACIREIRKRDAMLPVLILTTFNEEEYIFPALASGANGYLLKNMDYRKLVQTIRDAANGELMLPAEVAAKIAGYVVKNDTLLNEKKLEQFLRQDRTFTKKEHQFIAMLLDRLTNKEMADKLCLSHGTVKNNLSVLFSKLGVQNRQDAVRALEQLVYGKPPDEAATRAP